MRSRDPPERSPMRQHTEIDPKMFWYEQLCGSRSNSKHKQRMVAFSFLFPHFFYAALYFYFTVTWHAPISFLSIWETLSVIVLKTSPLGQQKQPDIFKYIISTSYCDVKKQEYVHIIIYSAWKYPLELPGVVFSSVLTGCAYCSLSSMPAVWIEWQ